MSKKLLGGMEIEVDEEGFIQESDKWNEAVAEDLGRSENAHPLTDDHWKVIRCIRDFYVESRMAPPVRMLCKRTGFSLQYIYRLFPNGPAKGGCKVAGLPQPTGCL